MNPVTVPHGPDVSAATATDANIENIARRIVARREYRPTISGPASAAAMSV